MSIQRWDDNGPNLFGMYVTYTDHVAALAAQATAHEAALAEATENAVRDYAEAHYANGVKHYQRGVSDERARVRAGVEALPFFQRFALGPLFVEEALAVIDGKDAAYTTTRADEERRQAIERGEQA